MQMQLKKHIFEMITAKSALKQLLLRSYLPKYFESNAFYCFYDDSYMLCIQLSIIAKQKLLSVESEIIMYSTHHWLQTLRLNITQSVISPVCTDVFFSNFK